MMATMFVVYIVVRCKLNPSLGPVLPAMEERDIPRAEKAAPPARWSPPDSDLLHP